MATRAQLSEWALVRAPVAPNRLNEWAVVVNAERYPTLALQKEVVREAIEAIGGSEVEFLQAAPTRLTPAAVRQRRENLELSFIPTVRGKPVWWRVQFAWRHPENESNWPAERHEGFLGFAPEDLGKLTDPTEADVLLDSVGGRLPPAGDPPPTTLDETLDSLGRSAKGVGEGLTTLGSGLLAASLLVGGLYLAAQFTRKGR